MNIIRMTNGDCMARNVVANLLTVLLLLPSPARARKPPTEKGTAAASRKAEDDPLQSLREGIRLYNAEEYQSALVEFKKARDKAPDKANPYRWLAQTYAKLGDCEAAAKELTTFLLKSPKSDKRTNDVADEVKACRPALKPVPAAPPPVIVPSPPQPQPSASPSPTTTASPSAPTTPPPPITAVVQPAPPPQGSPTEALPPILPTPPLPEPAPPGRGRLWGGVALIAAGVAIGVGSGVGFGLAADGKAAAIRDQEDRMVPFDPGLDDARLLFQKLTYAAWAAGGALAVTGTVLAIIGSRHGRRHEATALHFVPAASDSGAGVTLVGTF